MLLPEIADACSDDELIRIEQEKIAKCTNKYEKVLNCEKDLLAFSF